MAQDYSFLFDAISDAPRPPTRTERRATGRLRVEHVRSDLGTVVDLSAGGVRVIANKVPTAPCRFVIGDGEHEIEVRAELVWSRLMDDGRFEMGMRFLNPDTDMLRTLSQISVDNRAREND